MNCNFMWCKSEKKKKYPKKIELVFSFVELTCSLVEPSIRGCIASLGKSFFNFLLGIISTTISKELLVSVVAHFNSVTIMHVKQIQWSMLPYD